MPKDIPSSILQNLDTRTFIQEGGPSGSNAVEYMGCTMLGNVAIPLGDKRVIWCPSPDQYRAFVPVDREVSRPGNPTTELTAWMQRKGVDRQARMAREKCAFNLYQNMGRCSRPENFDEGEKTLIIEGAEFTEITFNALGVLDSDSAPVAITTPIVFEDAYEVVPITFSEKAAALVTVEVVDVAICDAVSCGDCDDPSNGCEDIYAITLGTGGSPGNAPEIIYSNDQGVSWAESTVSTYNGSEGVNAIACVGSLLVVCSDLGQSHSWANKSDPTTWTEVSSGYVAGKGPRAIWVKSEREVFFAARGGYIYKAVDVTSSVTAVEAGVQTTQNFNDIGGYGNTLVAVGASNAVVFSKDGGVVWNSVTGPAVAIALNCVWVKSYKEWWVGTANGKLYYTINEGSTWTEKTFSGSGAGTVDDVVFTTPSVGYMAHATATPVGQIFKTKDGGFTWKNTSDYVGTMPDNDRINNVAVCQDPNFVVGVGLGGNATDGIIVVGA